MFMMVSIQTTLKVGDYVKYKEGFFFEDQHLVGLINKIYQTNAWVLFSNKSYQLLPLSMLESTCINECKSSVKECEYLLYE